MSSLFKATVIKGNRLTDFANTTATVGVTIPFGYGKFPADGNIIFAPLPPKEHVSRKRQGKGGVKQETFTYTLSYAVAFVKGPIAGYLWIKRNGKIVYTNDPNAPAEDLAYAAKWLDKATLYYGTATQLPDSTIESYKGTGNVSAFRHLAYIVVEDDVVTEGGGAAPGYEACAVMTGTLYLTSHPYPYIVIEGIGVESAASDGKGYSLNPDEFAVESIALDGTLASVTLPYLYYTPESFDVDSVALDGQLNTVIAVYSDYDPESIEVESVAITSELNDVVLPYENYDPESIDIASVALDGTLTEV